MLETQRDVPRPTQIGVPLPFDAEEYAKRVERARAALDEQRLDALVLFHQESMYYLFGYDQLGYWVYQAAVLTPDGEITVLSRGADHDLIAGLPGVSEVRTWKDDSHDEPALMTRDLLADAGVLKSGARVGLELRTHALLPYHHGRLHTALSEVAQVVDASDLISELRLHKSPAEVEYTRQAGRVVDAGYAAAFAALRPGAREVEVLGATLSGMFSAGGNMPAIAPPLASGPRTLAKTHGAATQRVIEPDELFQLEVGGCCERYHAVGVQSKWLGTPPQAIADHYEGLLESLAAGREATAAGTPVADVAKAVNRTMDRNGALVPGAHVGYGTGIGFPPTWLDNLRIKETDLHVLEAGVVFFMFVHETVEHDGVPIELFVGEPMLVTEGGADRLSSTPMSLELSA
jgi:Xaa-Pro dipeptidase